MTVLPALKDSVLNAAIRRAQYASAVELAPGRPRNRWRSLWRLAAGGIGVVTAATVAVLLSLSGGASTSTAFANWSATPTTPMSGQLRAAELFCRQQNPNVGSNAPTVADVRGPYSLLVYADSPTITDCTAGAQGTLMSGQSPAMQASPVAPASIKVESWGFSHMAGGGQIASVLDGQAGAGVRAIKLTLDSGTSIQTTVANGWFAAWWPGQRSARSAEITTASGTITQALHIPINTPTLAPPAPSSAG
jgi:hypothetical protein